MGWIPYGVFGGSYILFLHKKEFDVVVDEIHGIPFLRHFMCGCQSSHLFMKLRVIYGIVCIHFP